MAQLVGLHPFWKGKRDVDQNIYASKMPVYLSKCLGYILRTGDIAMHHEYLATQRSHLLARYGIPGIVNVGGRNVGPVAGQAQGNRMANATVGAGAGDYRHFAREIEQAVTHFSTSVGLNQKLDRKPNRLHYIGHTGYEP
jgi:hypothetical protein